MVGNTNVKTALVSFFVGILFAIGLAVSGMTQPAKVVGFLDIFGNWDPSLIFVMAGAVFVHGAAYRFIRKRSSPLLSTEWHVPHRRDITKSLLLGAFLFGVGWGIAGYCPGPAVTSLASGSLNALLFIGSMLFGMFLFRLVDQK